MKNTGIGTKPMEFNPELSDPYTGAGRYVPPGEHFNNFSLYFVFINIPSDIIFMIPKDGS